MGLSAEDVTLALAKAVAQRKVRINKTINLHKFDIAESFRRCSINLSESICEAKIIPGNMSYLYQCFEEIGVVAL